MDKTRKWTDKQLQQMERHIAGIYRRASADVKKAADDYFGQFSRLDKQKRQAVKDGKLSDAEYKTWRKNKMLYSQRFTDLQQQISMQLLHTNETALAYINGELPEIYSVNYNAIAPDLSWIDGYSFTMVDANTVKNLATTDKSFLPYKKLDPSKDIPWNMRAINTQVLQGILAGESIPKISARMLEVQAMDAAASVRTARTVVTASECKGRYDSYRKAQGDGVIMGKYWISNHSERTRDWHADAGDNYSRDKAIPIDQPFEVRGEYLMYPGDTSLGATGKNIYNCRCSVGTVILGFRKVKK